MNKSRFHGATALWTISVGLAVAGAAPAFAQDATSGEPEAPTTAKAPDNEPEVVVTGSRLRRDPFNSPDPVTIIDPSIAQAQGQFSTAEMLQSSTIASGSSQNTAAISSNFVTNGGPGSETISLRGLGAERTLVLLNGRRAGPAGTRGGVSSFDLNVLPQSIVQSVEILKTGASSVYGSDAIAGVVNLITKRDTNGLELTGFASVPQQSGGEQYRLAGAWGKTFDRGHIMIAGDYFKRQELKRQDRDYLGCPEEYIFRPDGSRADLVDPRTGNPRCNDTAWGHNWVYTSGFAQLGRWQYDYDGSLAAILGNNNAGNPANFGAFPSFGVPAGFYRVSYGTRPTGAQIGADAVRLAASVDNLYHPFIAASTVVPESSRYTAYVDGAYEITDSITVGTELLFNRRETKTTSFGQFYYLTGYTTDFGGGNPFSPGWTGPYYVSPTPMTDHVGSSQRVDYYRGVAYADGKLFSNWDFNIWGQFSRSDGDYENDVIFNDAIDSFNYKTSTCVGTNTPISNRPCVDINWLDPRFLYGDLNAAERNMLYGRDYGNTRYDQYIVEGSVAGKIINLPAGAAQAAIGAVWRYDEINDTPGENQRIDNNFVASAAGITAGYTITKEAFAEAELPLIHNTPLINSFTLSGSARITDVTYQRTVNARERDSTKGNWTYSIGANWVVTDWLRFRARYGTSFRAPALFELFLADQTSGLNNRASDPCVNHAANAAAGTLPQFVSNNCATGIPGLGIPGVPGNVLTGGGIQGIVVTGGGINQNLEPERSTAKSFSVVLSPRFAFLPGTRLNVAVDYFDISVKDEIATLSAAQILSGCYRSENFGTSEALCALFSRRAAGTSTQFAVDRVSASFINIAEQRNEGLDVTINVTQDLGKFGKLSVLSQMTWQFKDEIAVLPGVIQDNNGESGDPKWTGDLNIVWSPTESTSLFYGLDVIGQTNDDEDYKRLVANNSLCQTGTVLYGDYCVELTGEKKFYHSFSISQKVGKTFELTLGVANLFNTKPPRTTIQGGNTLNNNAVSTLGNSVFASQYDLLGRRFFINATARY